ncbi:MAG: family 43 glycosylhydrolase [Alphaproteobacteria bacterium]
MQSHFRVLCVSVLLSLGVLGQPVQGRFVPNYDESRIPKYTLPSLLTCVDGTVVTDSATWKNKRRSEVLALFETHVYGKTPRKSLGKPKYSVESSEKVVFGGKEQPNVVRKLVTIRFPDAPKAPQLNVLIYLPKSGRPVPAFAALNFRGNHTVVDDPAIPINEATKDLARGALANRWPVPLIVSRGYAVATMWHGELMPDRVKPAFGDGELAEGRSRAPDEWGAIGTWAWGLSRVMDYLQTDSHINPKRVASMGLSRLGKASLWAGAQDERFAIVISNESGGFGAALTRRKIGGTDIAYMTRGSVDWLCENLRKYAGNENACPVDQHMLIALTAPRPVYVASAEQDIWCDPKGEFLAAIHADPVYRLFGLTGIDAKEQPRVNTPVGDFIGYHIRTGKHNVTDYDWKAYLDFADRHFQRATTYTNPIVAGDWSDPAVIHVGEDYYSVCSTNQWQPGIPIIHSKDLVHWRYIGHAFRSNPQLRPGITSGGVYGLEMGYNPHTRMFLIYAPLSNRELYVYYAPSAEGPYEVKHMGRLGIDPGFFVDTDGRLYLVMYKGEIYELEKDGLSVKRLVTRIDTSRYDFFEGPDIFKRGDWYYCLFSDGGTRPHQPSTISVLRSRRIEGPWKEDPGNPVMFATDDGSPIQGPAHGTLIETQNGEWFVTFHAHELSHYSLGRPMCMAPIDWTDDGWWRPRHGKAPNLTGVAPKLPARVHALAQSDEFDQKQLGLQWFFHTAPPKQGDGWSLTERPGWLRIHSRAGKPIEKKVLPAVFLQRVTNKRFRLATRVVFDAAAPGHAAGLCMYHDPGMNFWLTTTHRDGKRVIEVGKTNNGERKTLWTVENKIGVEVHLRIDGDGEESATFYYGPDGKQWTRLGGSIYFGDSWQDLRNGRGGDPDLGWVGIKKRNAWSAAALGVFAVRAVDGQPTPADFDFVQVTTGEPPDVPVNGAKADVPRPRPGSLQELVNLKSIPRVKPWRTAQASSGLIDRFEDYGNFIRQEPGRRYVLMDVKGAGCIDRIWCLYKKGRPQEANFDLFVYLDGEERPTIKMDMNDLFGGKRAPFVAPLVGRCGFEDRPSSYSFVPIGFRKSCKVVAVPRDPDEKLGWRDRDGKKRSHFIFFYQLTYRLCPVDVPVKPFSWKLDKHESRALTAVQSMWGKAGKSSWPLGVVESMNTHTARAELADPGQATLLDHDGGGTLRSMRLRIKAGNNSPEIRQRLVESLWLDMTWEGAEKPQVSAPLGTFFAAPDSAMDIRGLWLGCADGQYYCHLPMPYRRHARVTVRLTESFGEKVAINATFRWDATPPHDDDALFHARRYDISKAPQGKNLLLLSARGRGHVVGVVADRHSDVESDDSWYFDGETEPSILGTGTEDFFNFAWGLGDLQALPMHGARVPFGPPEKRGQRTDTGVCYRFHLPAAYPFRKSLRLTWEHGSGNHDTRGRYSGITYYYMLRNDKPASR